MRGKWEVVVGSWRGERGSSSEERGPRVRELKIVLHYFFTGIVFFFDFFSRKQRNSSNECKKVYSIRVWSITIELL